MNKEHNHNFIAFLSHLHPRQINYSAAGLLPTFCMGGLSFFFFLLLVFTGILLMFFYQPGQPETAFASLTIIEDVAAYGGFIRSIHKWAGQAMVIAVVFHLIRVGITGSYRPPREGNWVIGVALLVLTIFLDFTGYLLIGDATSRYAAEISYALIDQVPGLNSVLRGLIFGSEPASELAGLRIYLWHCLVLPLLLVIFAGWHFYRTRKDGGVKWPL